ncbi:type II secretion system minor pseudopilin GspK [Thiothrix fructosivorans]|uniref:Type II secretion system protein K n=1 Tax=Thiothrix fructosivorans TaxID=111770 RepID=A0A8B0SK04_9GAMM|nr:type II secretion system minor pseudopilin GspK [Thiothrix fructosivorans]MBO0612869.1 type II secretion system minor pseudopilin GspK [Thiothrix fructosivorans]QTX11676.1 type II secretion system minor pseudopilin GspK [Thiothrix fructosivorans]
MQFNHPLATSSSPRQQRGIAILSVLVIAVLVVTLAAVIFARQSRAVRQTDNFQSLERSWQYVLMMEQYAGLQLQLDAKDNKYDALTDRWAQTLPEQTLTEESGAVVRFSGKLEDMQGRFNLNNLVSQEGEQRGKLDGAALGLLKPFVTDAGLPAGFTDAIADWLDSNQQPEGIDGAERDYYLSGAIPYLAADMPLVDPSELRLIRLEMPDPNDKNTALNQLLTTVTALPFKKTTINPNTASKEVLKALRLADNQITQILDKRKLKQVYKSKAEFQQDMAFVVGKDDVLINSFDVTSQYFRLTGEVRINHARVFVNSLLLRDAKGAVRVIMRQFDRVNEQPITTNDASNTPANTE